MADSDGATRAVRWLAACLLQGANANTRNAHRRVVEGGQVSVALLQKELARIDLKAVAHNEAITLAVGLATALHDVDECASRRFLESALAGSMHPSMRAAFRSIAKFSLAEWRRSSHGSIAILESIELDSRFEATDHVSRWLENLPAADIAHISRIYIVRDDASLDYWGTHLPVLAVITLVWKSISAKPGLLTPLARRVTEATLYHEVGHHALKHQQGGQDPEQEAEADAYSRSVLKRVHPNWSRLFAVLGLAGGTRRRQDG